MRPLAIPARPGVCFLRRLGLFQEYRENLCGVMRPNGVILGLETRPELEQAAWAVRGHERSPAFQDILLLVLPEMRGDLGVVSREDAAEPAAGRRLFLLRQVKPERPQELGGLIPQPELGEIVAGIMIVDLFFARRLGRRKMSFGSHESGEILDPAGETRGSGVEGGVEVFEGGVPGGGDGG